MDGIQIIGTSAAILTTLANIPQTYKIIRNKNTEGVSAYTYSILLLGTGLWVVYGVMNNDWPVIIANSITVITCLFILILNFTSKRVIAIIHEKVIPEDIQKEVRDSVPDK